MESVVLCPTNGPNRGTQVTFDLSDHALEALAFEDLKAEAARVLHTAYGSLAPVEALTRARTAEAAGNVRAARVWVEAYLCMTASSDHAT